MRKSESQWVSLLAHPGEQQTPLTLTLWLQMIRPRRREAPLGASQKAAPHLRGSTQERLSEAIRVFVGIWGQGHWDYPELWEKEMLKDHVRLDQSWHCDKPNSSLCKEKTLGAGLTYQKMTAKREGMKPTHRKKSLVSAAIILLLNKHLSCNGSKHLLFWQELSLK